MQSVHAFVSFSGLSFISSGSAAPEESVPNEDPGKSMMMMMMIMGMSS